MCLSESFSRQRPWLPQRRAERSRLAATGRLLTCLSESFSRQRPWFVQQKQGNQPQERWKHAQVMLAA